MQSFAYRIASLKNQSNQAGTQFDDINLAYLLEGSEENEPIVFVMGLGASMVSWDRLFCRSFSGKKHSNKGYQTLVFDNRDSGKSTNLDHVSSPSLNELFQSVQKKKPLDAPYSLRDMARDVVGLLDVLGFPKAHIVGASMGGMIAQELAIHFPERVSSLAVIMSTTGHPSLPLGDPKLLQVVLSQTSSDPEEQIQNQMDQLRLLSGDKVLWKDGQLRNYAKRVVQHGIQPAGTLRQMAAIISSPHRREGLKKIKIPTMVIHGAQDHLIPVECGRDVAKYIPDSTFLEIETMGHSLHPVHWPMITEAILRNIQKAPPIFEDWQSI